MTDIFISSTTIPLSTSTSGTSTLTAPMVFRLLFSLPVLLQPCLLRPMGWGELLLFHLFVFWLIDSGSSRIYFHWNKTITWIAMYISSVYVDVIDIATWHYSGQPSKDSSSLSTNYQHPRKRCQDILDYLLVFEPFRAKFTVHYDMQALSQMHKLVDDLTE